MLLTKENFTGAAWDDWKFHTRNLIRTKDRLAQWVTLSDDDVTAIDAVKGTYRWMVTPYYASLMSKTDDKCPIRLQAIPHRDEMNTDVGSDVDPVGDATFIKTRRVIHKYPNRVVFLVSDTCPVYCRFCTRKYHTASEKGTYYNTAYDAAYDPDFEYIGQHKEISDVLLTGGDPLILNDEKLEQIISTLRSIPHVKIIRIGSRYPVFLPQRITDGLCSMLDRYRPIWLSTHFNHPIEVSAEAAKACDRLLRHGIPVQNQTVLLKGVNDNLDTLKALFRRLIEIRVRPYYLYHCDRVTGVSHFVTGLEQGQEIVDGLVGFETGFSVPSYVVTTKLGKIPAQRPSLFRRGDRTYVRNYNMEVDDITDYLI
ncbi:MULTISPECIES: arginine 2,3-aminomutase [unclassified Mesorhizobium]|uniref:arginine 2,3-aminomutase n=1 Tax=unclassified Mesorhizobium TaxID=325217 RepID=UPI00333877DC